MSSAQLRRLRFSKVPQPPANIKNGASSSVELAGTSPLPEVSPLGKECQKVNNSEVVIEPSPAERQQSFSTETIDITKPTSLSYSLDSPPEAELSVPSKQENNQELSKSHSRTENPQIIGEELPSSEQSDDEIPKIQFESSIHRFNDGSSKKTIQVGKDLGMEEERVLKKVIKGMSEKRKKDRVITSIEGIKVIVDSYYPRVKMQYKLNGQERDVNILNVYKGEKDPHARNIITKIFNDNFKCLSKSACQVLMEIVRYRRQFTQQKYVGEYDYREHGLARTLVAVYSVIPNGTIDFVFVDIHYGEISFNNFFIEEHKKFFPEAYAFYEKTFKPRLSVGNDQSDANGPHALDNEEISSDDEKEPVLRKPLTPREVRQRIDTLFKEDLGFYEDRINEKQQEYAQYQQDEDQINEERLEQMKERIEEMWKAFDNYKYKRESLRKDFEALVTGKGKSKTTVSGTEVKLGLIYKHLRMLRTQLKSDLPIMFKKEEIFEYLQDYSLIILEGQTGSGKSTQLPQMLCEFYGIFKDEKAKPIMLTQPRKIATRALAERIAYEMEQQVYGFVDYVASSGKGTHRNSKIIVKLDRLLLEELELDPLLSKYSCLMLDEAHERTISIDIIIGLVSNILKQRKDFKVIITSATLDADLFENYFSQSALAVKKFKLPGRLYQVTTIHKPYPQEKLIEDKIYRCITEELLEDRSSLKSNYKGHVLCFCTGIEEINRLCRRMKEILGQYSFLVVALHGKMTIEQQKIAFSETPGKSKIIFCTRIAETAITIDKVKVVIDPGQDRLTHYDQNRKISSFQLGAISKSAARQRTGRAGRTSEGYCFRLYDEQFEQLIMTVNKIPEIESTPLDLLVLRLKTLKVKDLRKFPYLEKPNDESLKASMESMHLIGCLDDDGQITPIGRAILRMPIEPFLSRAIIEGMIIEKLSPTKMVVEKIVKILAIVANNQSVFASSEDSKEFCEKARFKEFAEPQGDFFSLLNVYEAYENEIIRGRERVNNFVRQRYLNKKSLLEANQLIREIMTIVGNIRLNPEDFEDDVSEVQRKITSFPETKDLVLSCLLTSFCQNLCLYSENVQIGYTMISTEQPIQIYNSSFLALQGINPKWIVCYDISKTSFTFCRIAQQVTFDMLRASVSKRVFQKYRLDECQHFNPFYARFERPLPTVVLKDLESRKIDNEDDPVLPWLRDSNCIFDRGNNRLTVYVSMSKLDNVKTLDKDLESLASYIQNKPVFHSFLGSVTAEMGNGCAVRKLNLHNNLYSVKLSTIDYEMQQFIQEQYGAFSESIERNKKELVITFNSEEERDKFIGWKNRLGESEPELEQCQVEIVKNYFERKNRVPMATLKLVYWASLSVNHERLLLLYPDERYDGIEKTPQLMSETRKYLQYYFTNLRFSVSKKGNSITVYLNRGQTTISDEYQMNCEFLKVYAYEAPPLVHIKILAFREYDDRYSLFSVPQWVEVIQEKFENIGEEIPEEDIKIYGTCQDKICADSRPKIHWNRHKREQRPQRDCEKHMTEINASIRFFSSKVPLKFIEVYNGKQGILGTEKVHAKLQQYQCIIRVPGQVYSIFRARYFEEKKKLEDHYKRMLISTRYCWYFNKKTQSPDYFMFISCESDDRESLLTAGTKIRELFSSFLIRLEPEKVKAINRSQGTGELARVYESIFSDLQLKFDMDICFEYFSMRNQLRVYCRKELFESVQAQLNKVLGEIKEYTARIDYRGKNVYKVQEIIDSLKSDVEASLSFSERCIHVSGPEEKIIEFRNRVEALSNSAKDDCQICFNVLSMPFRLLNCGHTFCTNCIVNYLRNVKDDSSKYPLMCPEGDDCKKLLSPHDLRMLLEYEEFNRACDRGVQKLVDNIKYHSCYTVNCEQIFDVARTVANDNMFECDICNLSYCRLCQKSGHKGISCEKYKEIEGQEMSKQELVGLEIKKCEKCGQGIQRNDGCSYVNCSCGAKICWKCNRAFKSIEDCQEHLPETCEGEK